MSGHIVATAGLVMVLLVTGLAVWKGGRAERLGGVLVFATWIFAISSQVAFGESAPVYIILASDGALAVGFLVLTLRFASVWLGVALLLQSAGFALHSSILSKVHAEPSDFADYIAYVNLLSFAVLLLLLGATLVSWMRRARRTAEDALVPA